MVELITGSFLLSLVHAVIPNHWAPVVTLARSQGWTLRETMGITVLTGLIHTLSTVLLGLAMGMLGIQLASAFQSFTSLVAPLGLMAIGLLYIGLNYRQGHHSHLPQAERYRSRASLVLALCVAMFFSPCLEIQTYYLAAGAFGWSGLVVVSAIYLLVSVGGMVTLVALGFRGLQRLHWQWLQHYEKLVTGGMLIGLGLLSFFIH